MTNQQKQRLNGHEIVERIAKGDRAAEIVLVNMYQRPLLEMLKYRTQDRYLAEDLLQDTLRIIIERLRGTGIKEPKKLSCFIHGTAKNIVIAHYRKEIRRGTHANTDIVEQAVAHQKEQLLVIFQEEQSLFIRKLLEKLSTPRDREILTRFYVWEQDKPQVCQAMALTVNAFDRVVSRARKRFKVLWCKELVN